MSQKSFHYHAEILSIDVAGDEHSVEYVETSWPKIAGALRMYVNGAGAGSDARVRKCDRPECQLSHNER